jgi:hypothetical protein
MIFLHKFQSAFILLKFFTLVLGLSIQHSLAKKYTIEY